MAAADSYYTITHNNFGWHGQRPKGVVRAIVQVRPIPGDLYMNEKDAIPPSRLTGNENFHQSGNPLDFRVLDFWQWSASTLVGNALRGILAEYLVASACGIDDSVRVEWDAVDIITKSGIRIEVKSSAYIQSWKQNKLSKIQFDIAPKHGWDAATNQVETHKIRSADVYVFCLLNETDQNKIDPLNIDQWQFYVANTSQLNESFGQQKKVGLNSLRNRMALEPIAFKSLYSAIQNAASASS